jgi:hypothetical protein
MCSQIRGSGEGCASLLAVWWEESIESDLL